MRRWCVLWLFVSAYLFCARLSSTQQGAPTLAISLRELYIVDSGVVSRLRLCIFSDTPPPVVTWTRNGQDLPTTAGSGGVYYLEGNGTLVISGAGPGDNGEYECTGTNSLGQMTTAKTELRFIRQSTPWYISWYMWFIYAIILWGISIFFFIAWFFFLKKRAIDVLPAPDDWIGT